MLDPKLGPVRLGPFRLEERLGRGGMGEVYRAFDERLERLVAVKLVRRDNDDPRVRERFRREARAAAALNHPAIVQIHDIVETEAGEAIVMELVAGQTLASLVQAAGPLSPSRALRLGSEIAEGLAAAHVRGIVHRDLKPENVMVTASGHAKILDFGLAKRAEPEGAAVGETSLTVAGAVLGTYRAMSPEQARGLTVGPGSDLFSLGSLLYEALTGVSPFQGATVLDTLTRICTSRQAPVAALRPEVPAAASELVDRLLEKDPAARPASAEEVAAALAELAGPPSRSSRLPAELTGLPDELPTLVEGRAVAPPRRFRMPWRLAAGALLLALALGLAAWAWHERGSGRRLYVAVPKPEIGRGAELAGVDLAAAGLRIALLHGLLGLEGVSPLAPEQVDPAPGPPRALARAVAADEVVTSRLDCDGATCQATLSRVRGADGTLLWTQSFPAPAGDPYLLAEAGESYLRRGYPERGARSGFSALDVRPSDYTAFLRLRQSFEKGDLPLPTLLDSLDALCRRSPRFVEGAVLAASVLRFRFKSGRDPADLERGFAVLDRARQVAPADPRPLSADFELALAGERLPRAESDLRELERAQPGDPEVLVLRALLDERRGETAAGLALLKEAVRRRPSWKNLIRLADMEYRHGESAAVRVHLNDLLARFPGHYQARSLLAQNELLTGNPERAAQIYSQLVARSPRVPELTNLGTAYLLLRRYPQAEERFRQALALEPRDPFLTLDLADVLLLGGKRGAAEETYRRLLDLTAREAATGGAGGWQLLSVRAQALAHLGDRRRAVEAAQRVLLLASDNAQAAFEVATVYALVGDQSSALVNAARALQQGVQPIWFSFPWFDPLRSSAEFQALFAARPPAARP